MEIVSCYYKGSGNLGDALCNTFGYFPYSSQHRDIRSPLDFFAGRHVIIGGGGMIRRKYYPHFERLLEIRRRSSGSRLVIWSAGMNLHGEERNDYPGWLTEFDLVGLRDFGNPYHYVPCASCMDTEFDRLRPPPVHPWVVYEHRHAPVCLPALASAPRRDNRTSGGLRAALDFLASGERVVTSSFHGAYWSMLLGRAVWLYKPFSSKFFSFPVALPLFADELPDESVPPASPPGYLADCRHRNQEFATSVRQLLGLPV